MNLKFEKIEIILFFLFLIPSVYFLRVGYLNAQTRLCLTYSIVDRGKFDINPYHNWAGFDKSYYKGNYYTDKAPGASILGVPFYFLTKKTANLFGISQDKIYKISPYIVRVCVVSIPTGLFLILFYRFLRYFSLKNEDRVLVTFAYGFATGVFPESTLFRAHQISTIFLFSSFYILFILKQQKYKNKILLLFSGFLSGFSFIADHSTAIFIIPLILYGIYHQRKNIFFFLLGGIPPLLFFFFYHYICFDNPFTLATCYHVPHHDMPRSIPPGTLVNEVGLFKYPKLSAVFGLTFSPYRGLFFYSPFLILSIIGYYFFFLKKEFRSEFYLFLFSVTTYFCYISSLNFWEGGACSYPRYLIVILPFMAFPIIFLLDKIKKVFVLLPLSYSFFVIFIITITHPECPPEIYDPLKICLEWLLKYKKPISPNLATLFNIPKHYDLYILLGYLIFGFVILILTLKKEKNR